jgi:uncharacterized protein YegL
VEDNFFAQIPFGTDSFADNPEPRCPCLLLLDTSGSMAGSAITELNKGLRAFKEELLSDSLAMKRVEIGIVNFGPVTIENTFQTAPHFHPKSLVAQNDTPMGEAIEQGIAMIQERKQEYRESGISFYRPWIFLITDGAPTDHWHNAAAAIREGETSKSFAFFAVGVKNANMDILRQLSVREPLRLEGLKFKELFQWLSNSMRSVSQSTPGNQVALPSPEGWAEI